jgi:hypothetical protein
MAAPGNGGDIIVTGGSVDLEYDDAVYQKDPGDPKKHKSDRKIIRVLVVDEGGNKKYDSNDQSENPEKWTITTYTKR